MIISVAVPFPPELLHTPGALSCETPESLGNRDRNICQNKSNIKSREFHVSPLMTQSPLLQVVTRYLHDYVMGTCLREWCTHCVGCAGDLGRGTVGLDCSSLTVSSELNDALCCLLWGATQ